MSSGPPFIPSDTFNPNLVQTVYDSLSIANADARYIRIGGNGYLAGLVCSGLADIGSLKIGGSAVDLSSITGITSGTVSASKAVIVDTNKDIVGFNNLSATNLTGTLQTAAQPNITSLGTLTGLNLNGSMNLSTITTINNTCVWTSGNQPTTTNGIGIRFNGLAGGGTGYLRAYNYILGQDNNIDINNGNLYIKNNRYIGVSQSSPLANLHCTGTFLVDSGWTSAFTNMNGLIMYHDPAANTVGTSYIRSRNWTGTPADMNLDIQNQALFIDSTKKLGVWTTSPQTRIDVNQSSSISNRMRLSYAVGTTYSELYCDSSSYMHCTNGLYTPKLLLGDSTDTGRMISALDSTLGTNGIKYITLGKSNTLNNQAELSYFHAGDGSSNNEFRVGYNGGVAFKFRFDQTFSNNSQTLIDNTGKFVGSGGIDTTNRITMRVDGNGFSLRGNSSYPNKEMVSLIDGSGAAFGTYSNDMFSLLSQNVRRINIAGDGRMGFNSTPANGIQCYILGTGGNYPLWVDGYGTYTGSSTSAITWMEQSTTTIQRTTNWGGSLNISAYFDNAIIARDRVVAMSDRRLKKDIYYFEDSDNIELINGLRNLKICSFNWKRDDSPGFGIIAQDAMRLKLPELVSVAPSKEPLPAEDEFDIDGSQLSIEYQKLGVMLLPYVQHLERRIAELENSKK